MQGCCSYPIKQNREFVKRKIPVYFIYSPTSEDTSKLNKTSGNIYGA